MPIREEVKGRTLIVHLDREDKRNAINVEMALGISAALDRLDDDDSLWAGIITGTPNVFCAGTDLKDGAGARTDRGGEYGIIRRQRIKPLIAAVEGPCMGGGLETALACDLIVASTTARMALPETRRGLVATSGALFRVTRALPPNIARQLLITGAGLTAQRAYDLGLVNVVSEPGQALADALVLADDINASGPVAVRATLAALNEQYEAADAAGWVATGRAQEKILASDDMREGIDAFFEKRPPEWTAR
ncbi:enoyl-CoA hydratase-related protein [Gordonia rubripertincta]|uniref:Enoyl-CoA hydratase-related protein n=1 Tax=Gordonia rubripertincta TaxID=36822 RepID=A0ABT4N6H1_GORRU|nr:enoyl-CoA hydratase-related protein [Gordonia rubripertincta]MCZ4553522.1 enoyl-CoA hydratase-related protein [Gordonia rubripertincta]